MAAVQLGEGSPKKDTNAAEPFKAREEGNFSLGLEIFLPPVLWELFTLGAGFTCSFSPAPHGHSGEFCNIPGRLFFSF